MKKAKYIIINTNDEYFVKINEVNKAVFTRDLESATRMPYDDTNYLIPLIEMYNKIIVTAEQV